MSTLFNSQKHFYFKLFDLVKQFYFKQINSAYLCSFDVKTVLFQVVHFSISTVLVSKIFLFQANQFNHTVQLSLSMQFRSI